MYISQKIILAVLLFLMENALCAMDHNSPMSRRDAYKNTVKNRASSTNERDVYESSAQTSTWRSAVINKQTNDIKYRLKDGSALCYHGSGAMSFIPAAKK